MKVILARPRGSCAGGVRATGNVERVLAKCGVPVHVRHGIVHNGHVVESLKPKGGRLAENLSKAPPGSQTIIAHEVPGRGGRTVVSVGSYPQVTETMGRILSPVYLVQSEANVDKLAQTSGSPLADATQTTLSVDDTKPVTATLKQKFSDIIGLKTKDIRYATQRRQSAVRQLSTLVDGVLVVGTKNSPNSNRSRKIGAEAKVPSYFVSGESNFNCIREAGMAGLSARASVPASLAHKMTKALTSSLLEMTTPPDTEENIAFRLPSELLNPPSIRRSGAAAS